MRPPPTFDSGGRGHLYQKHEREVPAWVWRARRDPVGPAGCVLASGPMTTPNGRGRWAHPFLASIALLLLLAGLGGCGSISIEGADGSTPASQLWLVENGSSVRRHRLILSNVADLCSKRGRAEQDRVDALAQHTQRQADGQGVCESTDLYYDDLAAAYATVEGEGSRSLSIQLSRSDVGESLDAQTSPDEGTYAQYGGGNDGIFEAQLVYYENNYWQLYADAYDCLGPDDFDQTNWTQFINEVEPGIIDLFVINGGTVELTAGTETSWNVEVDADLGDATGATIGTVDARFEAERCDVDVSSDQL